jgi:hypothetical protein
MDRIKLPWVLRFGGVWLGLWALLMWFAPEAAVGSSGWEITSELGTMMAGFGMAIAGLAVLHFAGSSLADDAMRRIGFWAAVMWALFQTQQIYFLATGAFPVVGGQEIVGNLIGITITVLLFLKSIPAAD